MDRNCLRDIYRYARLTGVHGPPLLFPLHGEPKTGLLLKQNTSFNLNTLSWNASYTEFTRSENYPFSVYRVQRFDETPTDFRELVGGKNKVAEAEHSFSESAEFQVGLVEGFSPVVSHWLFYAIDEYRRRTIHNTFRCPFHHQQISLILRFVSPVYGYLRNIAADF